MKTTNHDLTFKNINIRVLPNRLWMLSIVVLLGSCSLLRAKTFENQQSTPETQKTIEANPVIEPPRILASSGDPNFVVKVVQSAGSAVVRIDSSRTITSRLPEEFNDPLLRRFFGDTIPQQDNE